jgi:hypothetical protein
VNGLKFHLEMKISSWCFFCRSKAPAWSLQAQLWAGEGAPSLFPPSAGQGLPHPQLRKWHRPPTSHSEETPGRPMGEASKQRASEPPLFTPLSLARASMKIWCFLKRDTAIKWRENATKLEPSLHFESCFSGIQLLVVEEPAPLAWIAHNVFGESPGYVPTWQSDQLVLDSPVLKCGGYGCGHHFPRHQGMHEEKL